MTLCPVTRRWPYTASCRHPMWARWPYPTYGHNRRRPLTFLFLTIAHRRTPLLSLPPLPVSSARHGQPPPSRLRAVQPGQKERLDVVHLLHRDLVRVIAYRSRATEVPAPPSTSVRSSLSTIAIWAPLASPPLQEEPLESVVRPRLHLRRRWPSVWAVTVIHLPSSSLTAARPLWWARVCPTTTHGLPLVESSSPAPPCSTSRRLPGGINRQSRADEGGRRVPHFDRGPKGRDGLGPLQSDWAEPV
jgi:hypothetical protein